MKSRVGAASAATRHGQQNSSAFYASATFNYFLTFISYSMDTKLGAPGTLQQPNVTGSAQQPAQGTNALQQPTGQVGALQQPTQLGSLQPSSQLGSNYLQPSSQLGSYQQQSSQPVSLQQPSTQLGSYQQPSQLGSLQQPISQQLGALQMGSFQQPGKVAPSSMQQQIKSDPGNMRTFSGDNWMVKQIQAVHSPDGRVVEIGPLLSLVEDILKRATLSPSTLITTGAQSQIDSLEQKTQQASFLALLDSLSFTIDRISREISYRATGGSDAHQTTLSIFQQLSHYYWDAKLVLTLAAFALHYGEFGLLAQIYTTNQLAKSIALLRQVTGLIEHASFLKPHFDALSDLIKAILEVTNCVVKFKELPSMSITPDVSTAITLIPTAVYWTIRSIVACATQIASFNSMGYEFAMSTAEARWELSTLAHKLRNMRDHLKDQLVSYQQPISQQLLKSHRGSSMITWPDENWIVTQIQATHDPDGRVVNPSSLLSLVEDILNRATLPGALITTGTQQQKFVALLDALSFIIDRISSEISYKALSNKDAHQTTLSIFQQLSLYGWDAKMSLVVAAFAVRYGEFWLFVQIYLRNQLIAKPMPHMPGLSERASALKPCFNALNDLIKTMLEVTRCVVKFCELPSVYIAPEVSALSTAIALIPTAAFWTIMSIVACATQITNFTSTGYEFAISATEVCWELSTLAHKLRNMRDHLKDQLEKCYQYTEKKKEIESLERFVKLFEMIHLDNMKVLKALICPGDDVQPLVDGSTKKRVSIEVLKRKNVLLLISGLNISQDELSILEQIYNESRLHPTRLESWYELVWIPVVDSSTTGIDSIDKQFQNMQSTMPWYTVQHPSLIEKAVVKFVKEKWHLRKKPILVALDPQGKVLSSNAIHMMWIWVSNAFPFTSAREEALWREETWRLELLVDSLDTTILNWIRDEKYIFLYGGDDIEWIRKFTNSARSVATAARIPLEMFYVGKGSKKEQVQRVIRTIALEKLSSYWQDPALIWFFWTRLESMLFSKIQLDEAGDYVDPVMQGIKTLLSYDREGGWALLSKGSSIVVYGHGTTVVNTLLEYDKWKEDVAFRSFDEAFKNHHDLQLRLVSHLCCRFELSPTDGRVPVRMSCPECHDDMEMEEYITFLCCHEKARARRRLEALN